MNRIEIMAALFKEICEQYDGAELGKKATQKLFYFIERMGLDLNLRYCVHFYGPYSSKLDDVMYQLEDEGYISINTEGTTHSISIGEKSTDKSVLSEAEWGKVNRTLKLFGHKTPLELEALSTMDYIANFTLSKNAAEEDIIEKFKQVKGNKFSNKTITEVFGELKKLRLIA